MVAVEPVPLTVVPVQLGQAGLAVTMELVIGDPSSEAVHPTDTVPLALTVAVTAVGADGAVGMMTGLEAVDGLLVPLVLVAVNVKVNCEPAVNPVMVAEVALAPGTVVPTHVEHCRLGLTV